MLSYLVHVCLSVVVLCLFSMNNRISNWKPITKYKTQALIITPISWSHLPQSHPFYSLNTEKQACLSFLIINIFFSFFSFNFNCLLYNLPRMYKYMVLLGFIYTEVWPFCLFPSGFLEAHYTGFGTCLLWKLFIFLYRLTTGKRTTISNLVYVWWKKNFSTGSIDKIALSHSKQKYKTISKCFPQHLYQFMFKETMHKRPWGFTSS